MLVTKKRLGREPFFVLARLDRVESDLKSGYHQGALWVPGEAAGLKKYSSAQLDPRLVVKALQCAAMKGMLRPPYAFFWSFGHHTTTRPAERHPVCLRRQKLGRVDQEIVLADGGVPIKISFEIQLLTTGCAELSDGGDEAQGFKAAR